MCHATSPSAVINNSLSVLLWDFSIIKQLSKTSNKPVKMFLERWTVIDTCLFHGQAVVDRLLSKTTDNSLLISRFQEFLEMEDVRYYVMSSVRENVCKVMDKNKGVRELCLAVAVLFFIAFIVTLRLCFYSWESNTWVNNVGLSCSSQAVAPIYQNNVFTLMSNISVPSQESELTNFMVKQGGETCFLKMW